MCLHVCLRRRLNFAPVRTSGNRVFRVDAGRARHNFSQERTLAISRRPWKRAAFFRKAVGCSLTAAKPRTRERLPRGSLTLYTSPFNDLARFCLDGIIPQTLESRHTLNRGCIACACCDGCVSVTGSHSLSLLGMHPLFPGHTTWN